MRTARLEDRYDEANSLFSKVFGRAKTVLNMQLFLSLALFCIPFLIYHHVQSAKL